MSRTTQFRAGLFALMLGLCGAASSHAQQGPASPSSPSTSGTSTFSNETIQDYNQKLTHFTADNKLSSTTGGDYRIGPEDLLDVSVLEAPEFNRTVRVSDDGQISLALLGSVRAAGLTTRELQDVLAGRLRQTYMKDPQVTVFVQEIRSHSVSVFGAVEKPGVYQIREAKSLIEILSMAQGLANDAGDSVIVERHGENVGPNHADLLDSKSALVADDPPSGSSSLNQTAGTSAAHSINVNLKNLLDSNDPASNLLVYPGDVVKVARAGIVYVLGQVHKPGGFPLKTNENISVLQAIAFAEGVTPNAKGKEARIFLSSANGDTKEVAINLDKVLSGRIPSPLLKPNDVLFVPNSGGKEALHVFEQSTAGIVGALGGAAIYRW